MNISELVVSNDQLYDGKGFPDKLPTGIITLDLALAGGIPLNGAIIEIYGEESHGKTTMSYRICKRCTDEGGYVTWVDSEVSYDIDWARVQGLNPSAVIPYRPPFMEAAMNLIINDINAYKNAFLPWTINVAWKPTQEQASAAGCGVRDVDRVKEYMESVAPVHMIVWDSLAASPVKSVAEDGSAFSEGMAYRARLIKMFLSRYQVAVVGCSKIGMILINQVIDNIGSYTGGLSTPGGRGLRHGKHISLFMKKSGGEKDVDSFKTTDYTIISLTKNKVTPVIASFPVVFSKSRGFLGATSLFEYLSIVKWFKDAGSWKKFNYDIIDKTTGEVVSSEEISFQKSNFYKLMEERPELFDYLTNVIMSKFIEKFPFSSSLKSTDVSTIVKACKDEATFMPDEEELYETLNTVVDQEQEVTNDVQT